jgi:protein gp37
MGTTKIEWTDRCWNVVTGCEHTPEQCAVHDQCYARRMANRLKGRFGYDLKEPFKPTFHADRLDEPIKIKKPQKFFVSTMGDLFGDWVKREWIEMVLHIVKNCPRHTFLFLTKNPKRYYEFRFPEHAWLGTTITSQADAHRIDIIKRLATQLHFLSIEPFKGKIKADFSGIDWIIVGAQTNPYKSPEKQWIDEIIKHCRKSDIPIFLKDNLNWPEKIQKFPEVR